MEPSDAGRTQLKEQRRWGGRGAERAELVAQTQKGGGANGDEEESRGREMEEEEGVHFKAAPAGNRRLGCGGVSVSRTNCFGTGENPFVPNQFFHANCVKITNLQAGSSEDYPFVMKYCPPPPSKKKIGTKYLALQSRPVEINPSAAPVSNNNTCSYFSGF